MDLGLIPPMTDTRRRKMMRPGQAADRQARAHVACAASQAILDEVAVVPLLSPTFNYGVSKNVVGFDAPHPFFLYFLDSKIGKR